MAALCTKIFNVEIDKDADTSACVETVAPIYSLNKVNTSVAPGENGRLDGETRVQWAGQGG